MMIQEKRRIEWIDMAKGWGMLLVILGHIGDLGEYAFFKIWFFSFHIPLFFFLSGYVFRDTDRFSVFLKKKLRSIIIPYFCLGIPMVLFQLIWDLRNGVLTYASGMDLVTGIFIQKRRWTIWFLACLFLLNILFYLLKKAVKKSCWLAVCAVAAAVIGALYYRFGGKALPWDFDACFMALPFFFAGYYYKEKHEQIDKFFSKKYVIALAALPFLAVNCALVFLNLKITGVWFNMYSSNYGCEPLTYIAAFAGIGFMICVSKLVTIGLIRYIGENSILYMAWQETIMVPIAEKCLLVLCSVLKISYDSIHILLHYAFVLVIIVALITLCNIIISRTGLRFMVGKRKKSTEPYHK